MQATQPRTIFLLTVDSIAMQVRIDKDRDKRRNCFVFGLATVQIRFQFYLAAGYLCGAEDYDHGYNENRNPSHGVSSSGVGKN